MKIIAYGTASRFKFQHQATEEAHKKHMKWLHEQHASFTPYVLVEDLPEMEEPKWLKMSEYRKLLKKEDKAC